MRIVAATAGISTIRAAPVVIRASIYRAYRTKLGGYAMGEAVDTVPGRICTAAYIWTSVPRAMLERRDGGMCQHIAGVLVWILACVEGTVPFDQTQSSIQTSRPGVATVRLPIAWDAWLVRPNGNFASVRIVALAVGMASPRCDKRSQAKEAHSTLKHEHVREKESQAETSRVERIHNPGSALDHMGSWKRVTLSRHRVLGPLIRARMA